MALSFLPWPLVATVWQAYQGLGLAFLLLVIWPLLSIDTLHLAARLAGPEIAMATAEALQGAVGFASTQLLSLTNIVLFALIAVVLILITLADAALEELVHYVADQARIPVALIEKYNTPLA